jgi:hypothetical protein
VALEVHAEDFASLAPVDLGRNILEAGLLLTVVLRTGELQGDRLRHRGEAGYGLTRRPTIQLIPDAMTAASVGLQHQIAESPPASPAGSTN